MSEHNAKPTMTPTGLPDAIDCLTELLTALERDDLPVARGLLRALVSHSAYLSDYDAIFGAIDALDPDVESWSRWARWQLGNLRLESVIDEPPDAPKVSLRETKPYPNAIANELVESSVRSTAERNAIRPLTGKHTSLDEETESSVASDDDLEDLDELISEIIDD